MSSRASPPTAASKRIVPHRRRVDSPDANGESERPARDAARLGRLGEIVQNTESKKQLLSSLHRRVPDVVTFQVGDEQFALTRSLIEKDPQSLLFILANNFYANGTVGSAHREGEAAKLPDRKRRRNDNSESHDGGGDRPPTAAGAGVGTSPVITIPEKDPALFRKILNVIRGYKSAIPDDRWREACLCDVAFYGLGKSWNEVFPAPEARTFTVKTSPHWISSTATCGLASPYYTTGVRVVTFAVSLQGTEKVAVGVETRDKDPVTDSVSHAAHGEAYNRALYWNDGNVTTFFSSALSFASGFPFKSPTLVRVFLDADEGTVRWMVRGCDCVAMVRLPKRECGYAFCAISQKGARIDIADMY